MHILVTGAAGFIGSHLCEALLDRGDRVTGIDNFDPFYDHRTKEKNLSGFLHHEKFRFFQTDIRVTDELDGVWNNECRDVGAVVHLAARAGVRPSIEDPAGYERTNVAGTLNVLQCVAGRDAKPKFIFASSSSVYGDNAPLPFCETDRTDSPVSPYAATKKAGEVLCRVYAHLHGIDTFVLRLFTVFGPRQRPDLAIHKLARAVMAGEPVEMYGDGTSCRDYTHVSDITAGIISAVDRCAGYEIINLGRADTVMLRNMIGAIENVVGTKAAVIPCDCRPGDVQRTCADISKARRLLDYDPGVKFMEGLRDFIAWLRKN